MFNYIKSIFNKKCVYQQTNTLQYLKCLNNKKIYLNDMSIEIFVIYDNINTYIGISQILIEYDYCNYITYDNYTYKKINKYIYLKDFFIDGEYIIKDKEQLIKILIKNTILLIDIYYTLNSNNNRINNFNSNILKQYIINVANILSMSIRPT